ncbi:GNAT family N-acetyltransferase [Thaumasiovibrio subtropicus]|uniref:GNAT family N-acetyltransferase n=1 Tax=Thaumasiovibrio subtropicus TaxID=1891207 RepID=UPI00192D0D5A|nr:GNAT family N-acetyltransferase [Thaumasiovibrio subtropicus]
MKIREMTQTDFQQFWPVFQEIIVAQETYAFDPEMKESTAQHLWRVSPLRSFVAEEDGTILGSYYLRANAAGPGDHVCNCGFMVSPSARGKGVARRLCTHAQQVAKAEGFVAMQFNSVVSTNQMAVNLWLSMGFSVIGRVPQAYRHATLGLVDSLIMHKFL